MQLIGMLDSPYVRRVAVSLQLMGLPFEHRSISVFRGFDTFRRISPVVKAPSLVCDDGTVLLDSTLILEYAEALASAGAATSLPSSRRSLMPMGLAERRQVLSVVGLALAACEKSVQVLYESQLRPADRQHAPWLERVTDQMQVAYAELEAVVARRPLPVSTEAMDQAGVSAAVAWFFTQSVQPGLVSPAQHPHLAAHSAQAECLPAFRAAPHGEGTYPVPPP